MLAKTLVVFYVWSPDIFVLILITQMDKCRVPTNIYIDLSKAFDTLNHDILLQKLKYYGITGTSVNLLQSYLSERYQYVEYNGHRSNTLPISTGVPQGSVIAQRKM